MQNSKVLKFGGSSLATAERMTNVLYLAAQHDHSFLVLSAIEGTTNTLETLAHYGYIGKQKDGLELIQSMLLTNKQFCKDLFQTEQFYVKGLKFIENTLKSIQDILVSFKGVSSENELLAFGEQISTTLACIRAEELGLDFVLLNSINLIHTDDDNEPNLAYIKQAFEPYKKRGRYILQGYICLDATNNVSNLKRGGSDYTASLVAEAVQASEVQIWTDIDGMHNNDPRVVENTEPIRQLSYNEAAELAYFGAKILHPQCVFPAQRANIPLRIKYTMDADAEGTLISNEAKGVGLKSIAAKEGIIAIKIKSSRMLMAYGFLKRVFEVFEKHRTPIDMITTSEVAVSLTIDDDRYLPAILQDLNMFGDTEVDYEQCIICIVGDLIGDYRGYASKIFKSLEHTPIRMVSYGGSKHNVSILVQAADKPQALRALHTTFFNTQLA